MKPHRTISAVALVIVIAGLQGPAGAHARLTSSSPKENSTLRQAPNTLELDFTEPPTGAAAVTVRDGCGDDVVSEISVSNTTVTAPLAEGQAGRWQVRLEVVSAVDGHPTRENFTFTVDGDRNCRTRAEGPPRGRTEEDSGFVLLLVGGGLLLLFGMLGIAYLSSRRKVD